MNKYINAKKLITQIKGIIAALKVKKHPDELGSIEQCMAAAEIKALNLALDCIKELQQEQPKFNVGDLVVSKKNPHLTYRILATNIPNELGKTDYKVEIFTDGKPGLLGKPHNIHLISSDKIEDWGELVQQEQPEVQVIQWTGHNLKEVIDFTGKSPRFGEWFKSWDEFESYVHSHGNILKLFSEDGSHFEVAVGAWIVKTPDGYNVPSVARFIHARQEPKVDLEEEIKKYCRNYYNCNYPDQIQNGRCSPVMPHIVEAARHFAEWGAIHLNARKEVE